MSRRPVTVAALALSAAVLSACGTGLQAQTYKETGSENGASTTFGGVAVRNLHVTPPPTGSVITTASQAVLSGVLINESAAEDSLVRASSDAAGTATLMEGAKPATSVSIPPASPVTVSITLSGLTKELRAGDYVTVTLEFSSAGRTTLQVPVRAGDNGLITRPTQQDPYGEPKV
ncbi:MAG: LpqE protein [Frankiales bacterium]|nr:LpqE protein [Frankiales bacterium]